MKTIKFDVEDKDYQEFLNIIEEKNLSLNGIIHIVMNKTIAENGVDWLVKTLRSEIASKDAKKKKAMQLFRDKGYDLYYHKTNIATKNSGNDFYWINPAEKCLHDDWYIILDDNIKKILYLIYIPQNCIKQLKMRNDKVCNVCLTYNDLIDIHTNINFKNYLIDEIRYNSLILQ